MSTKTQTDKNLKLTQKLIEYLLKGKNIPELPQNASFVPFSNSDEKLNKANEKLLEKISNQEKPLIKAEEPKTNKGAWKLIPVNF